MNKFEKIEKRMNEWQSGIRILYKDVQTNHNWTDDHVWKELENEIKRICPEGQFGEDDLAWTREILTSKRDITLWEAVRLTIRFRNSTPLLDALSNLRAREKSGN
tara:strand:- start:356 stop:670 length:315 start_codon:yes stop_codon:yes gene_type:complete